MSPTPEAMLGLNVQTLATIDEYGIEVCSVFGSDIASSWQYSIGLSALGSSEVVICGLPQNVGGALVNAIHRHVKDGLRLEVGLVLPAMLGQHGEFDITLTAVTDEHECFRIPHFYSPYRLLQAVFPDAAHRFPWDEGYNLNPLIQKDWWIKP